MADDFPQHLSFFFSFLNVVATIKYEFKYLAAIGLLTD